ncbi:hypothetical protein HDK77DRAFT_271593 [Phyllosticta capitalensis]|uniref:Uncharacterized protein n=1 Tax=Phyllosticta capitalensis TaxID=121624 RepID=A0ABR1YKG6_9PEZI
MADKPTPSSGPAKELPQRTRAHATMTATPNVKNLTSKTDKLKVDNASDAESDSSELSTSSEEPSSESDDESQAEDSEVEVSALPKPPNAEARKKLYQKSLKKESSLSDRLKAFLPQLAAANEELERDREAGRLGDKSLEQVDENGQYIEMNLGLGVLEEKDPNKMNDSDDESDDGDDESEDKMDTGAKSAENKEQDVLGKLMGKKKNKSGAGIQEVSET